MERTWIRARNLFAFAFLVCTLTSLALTCTKASGRVAATAVTGGCTLGSMRMRPGVPGEPWYMGGVRQPHAVIPPTVPKSGWEPRCGSNSQSCRPQRAPGHAVITSSNSIPGVTPQRLALTQVASSNKNANSNNVKASTPASAHIHPVSALQKTSSLAVLLGQLDHSCVPEGARKNWNNTRANNLAPEPSNLQAKGPPEGSINSLSWIAPGDLRGFGPFCRITPYSIVTASCTPSIHVAVPMPAAVREGWQLEFLGKPNKQPFRTSWFQLGRSIHIFRKGNHPL